MRKPRWQLSLSTLLLVVAVMVLGVSHYRTSRELAATRSELVDYRYQYGHLVVDDPARPHLLSYVNQENPWKWHVNLPKGKTYQLMTGVGPVPSGGIPNVSELQFTHMTSIHGTGENATLFVSLKEHNSDSLMLTVGCDGAQTWSRVIPNIPKWYARSVFTKFAVGYREPFTPAPDAPFVIFRYTERKPNPSGGSVDPSPTEGVVVWAVPVTDVAAVEPIEKK